MAWAEAAFDPPLSLILFVLLLARAYDCSFDILLTLFPLLKQSLSKTSLLKPLNLTFCKLVLGRGFRGACLDLTKTCISLTKNYDFGGLLLALIFFH